MNEKRVLIDAQEILRNGWCQNEMAKNSYGYGTGVFYLDAISFCCIIGAINKAACYNGFKNCVKIQRLVKNANNIRFLSVINDETGQTAEGVIKLLDNTIESLS